MNTTMARLLRYRKSRKKKLQAPGKYTYVPIYNIPEVRTHHRATVKFKHVANQDRKFLSDIATSGEFLCHWRQSSTPQSQFFDPFVPG